MFVYTLVFLFRDSFARAGKGYIMRLRVKLVRKKTTKSLASSSFLLAKFKNTVKDEVCKLW